MFVRHLQSQLPSLPHCHTAVVQRWNLSLLAPDSEERRGCKTAWIITIISPLSYSLYANDFKKPASRNNAISDFLRLWSPPRPSNDSGFPGATGRLMQIWSPAKWADRTMLSRPWVFLSRSHPGNCALSQTQLPRSLSLSCTPSSAASQSWKYNCGEREKFKHLLLIFY